MNIIINLNKSENITSQQAVTRVKKLFAVKKAGHAGTLDPIATGILIVCLNEATKITRFLSDLNKEYLVRLKLGERTDTYDITGRIIKKTDFSALPASDIMDVLKNFTGQIKQVPPMYSAIKIGGTRLYKLARKGIEIERPERTIVIDTMDLLSINNPYLDLKISCSKGTYIRTLCNDIGNALGVGACMVSLQRTRIGTFRIEDSVTMEEIRDNNGNKKEAFSSIDSALAHLPEIILDGHSYQGAKNGVPILLDYETCLQLSLLKGDREGLIKEGENISENLSIDQYVRIKSPEGVLFGIGKVEKNRIRLDRLLN